jgi:phage FluMu protein Com
MIRFRCEKCNRKLRAPNLSSGQKAHCPKCKHVMVIPGPSISAGQKNTSSSITTDQQKHAGGRLISDGPAETKENGTKKKSGFLRPYFDEATLFSISITLILLCVMSRTLWADVYKFYKSPEEDFVRMFFLFMFLFAGACLCVFHAFSKKEKRSLEKYWMLVFIAVIICWKEHRVFS